MEIWGICPLDGLSLLGILVAIFVHSILLAQPEKPHKTL